MKNLLHRKKFFFLMIRRPPRSTRDVDRRQRQMCIRDSGMTVRSASLLSMVPRGGGERRRAQEVRHASLFRDSLRRLHGARLLSPVQLTGGRHAFIGTSLLSRAVPIPCVIGSLDIRWLPWGFPIGGQQDVLSGR